ncbi:type II toxin-antitoxin system toxin DNA ADP-ribosyl transferase DarT [Rhizorhabdus sp. FW153]|uniref:type II toxin-antitoxin system toxin DNA ADP-ribosyl transferase DarT n=1 Tax=Rhizorhabdus sp. FW153 TaxID=3400216 RepID=UPI003CFB4B8C
MTPPGRPKIYHILHVDRLPSILASGGLLPDTQMHGRDGHGTVIGMPDLKAHRLTRPVDGHDGLSVGACVPFYLCPRSLMLYVIHRANHPNLAYRGGQRPIVHLEADMRAVVEWANGQDRRWAFTLGNASASYAEFRTSLAQLGDVNWPAVLGTDFSTPATKDAKQAEFLLEGGFPWELVERIGVIDKVVAAQVAEAMQAAAHRPRVEILRSWYY